MPVFTRIARAVAGAGLALALLPAQAFAEFDNVIAVVNDFTQLDVETLLA